MLNAAEMSNALRAPTSAQAPMPVAGIPDPFTQGGFGMGGFGMGQYQGAATTDREFTGGAMNGMGATSLGGGGTGDGQTLRGQAAAAEQAAVQQHAFNARREQEVMNGGMLVNRDLTADEHRAKRNVEGSEAGVYIDPRVEESYGRDLTAAEQRAKRNALGSESGEYTDPRISAEQRAASARYERNAAGGR